jgi:hypothetical protein
MKYPTFTALGTDGLMHSVVIYNSHNNGFEYVKDLVKTLRSGKCDKRYLSTCLNAGTRVKGMQIVASPQNRGRPPQNHVHILHGWFVPKRTPPYGGDVAT